MKRVLLIVGIIFISVALPAQDFVTRFLDKRGPDTNLQCISVSPKMIQEVLKMGGDAESNEVLDMISELKSMQMLTSSVKSKTYYEEALDILKKNSERFTPFGTYDNKSENYRIMVREKKGKIVELVMLVNDNDKFAVINFTGNMSKEFIDRIADSMKIKRS